MSRCAYIYCKAPLPDGADRCPRCGHPLDEARLRTQTFLIEAAMAVPERPAGIVDMHQIIPAHPKAAGAQNLVMDGLGIERAVLQSVPPEATSLQGNAELAALQAGDPDRYRASWYIDPREPDALAELEAAEAAGVRIIKLLPVVGYRLDDDRLLDFWRGVQAGGFTLLVHTGFITARHKAEEHAAGKWFNARYGDPLQLDHPARRFDDVPIIVAHSGGAIFHEAGAQLVTQHDNLFGDLSGMGIFALQRWLTLGTVVDWAKVFWGNDSPFFHYPSNLRILLDVLRQHDAMDLAPGLLRDHGAAFWARHLA